MEGKTPRQKMSKASVAHEKITMTSACAPECTASRRSAEGSSLPLLLWWCRCSSSLVHRELATKASRTREARTPTDTGMTRRSRDRDIHGPGSRLRASSWLHFRICREANLGVQVGSGRALARPPPVPQSNFQPNMPPETRVNVHTRVLRPKCLAKPSPPISQLRKTAFGRTPMRRENQPQNHPSLRLALIRPGRARRKPNDGRVEKNNVLWPEALRIGRSGGRAKMSLKARMSSCLRLRTKRNWAIPSPAEVGRNGRGPSESASAIEPEPDGSSDSDLGGRALWCQVLSWEQICPLID